MSMTNMTLRVDGDVKREASQVAEYYGFDLPSVTRAFYKQMIDTHSIPLDLHRRPEPFDSEDEAVEEVDALSMEMVRDAG